ncbi:MAG: hypothetical protein ACRDPW_08905 [Mycobacteriales bacterium]
MVAREGVVVCEQFVDFQHLVRRNHRRLVGALIATIQYSLLNSWEPLLSGFGQVGEAGARRKLTVGTRYSTVCSLRERFARWGCLSVARLIWNFVDYRDL